MGLLACAYYQFGAVWDIGCRTANAGALRLSNPSICLTIKTRFELLLVAGRCKRINNRIMVSLPNHMLRLERVWEERNRTPILVGSGAIMLAVAVVDWRTMPYVSLGFLYLFPIMLAAGFLPKWAVALLGLSCAVLAELFSSLDRSLTRLSLEALALAGCGLFVAELVHNRRMTL
jgi:hypothetical protein